MSKKVKRGEELIIVFCRHEDESNQWLEPVCSNCNKVVLDQYEICTAREVSESSYVVANLCHKCLTKGLKSLNIKL